jgi:hypothetical protein
MNEDELQRELERLARSEATSGRARLAKVTAIRTLQRGYGGYGGGRLTLPSRLELC